MENNYTEHCENLRMLEQAYTAIEKNLRSFICTQDNHRIIAFTRLLSLIIDFWVEVRLMKLLHETKAYSDKEKLLILHGRTFEDKWLKALDISFCKAFNVEDITKVDTDSVSNTLRMQYYTLLNTIKGDISQSRELRNRIAHGQWRFAFNGDVTRLSQDITDKLSGQNILNLKYRLELFKSLAQIIQDLAVSPSTFTKHFEDNYHRIENQRRNSDNANYKKYVETIVLNYELGKKKKKLNLTQAKIYKTDE